MKFLNNWTIQMDKLPEYNDFKTPLTEQINKGLCEKIIENKESDYDYTNVNSEVINGTWTVLKDMCKGLEYDKHDVRYFQKCGVGRFYGSSFITLPKKVKHTLFHNSGMIDLDQQKGHPTIAYNLGKKNGKHFSFIKEYIDNSDKIFKDTAEHFGIDIVNNPNNQDRIKWFYNLTIYGGGKDLWYKGLTDPSDKDRALGYEPLQLKTTQLTGFQKGFKENCDELKELIWLNNDPLREHLNKKHSEYPTKATHEKKDCLISFVMGIIENDCLHKAYLYLKKNKLFKHYKLLSLEYDGLCFIPKSTITQDTIDALNTYVKKHTGIEITYVMKPYKKHNIYGDMVDLYNKEMEDFYNSLDENSYEGVFERFNKEYAKVEELSMFVKIKEHDVLFFNKGNLKISYEDIRYEEPVVDKEGNIVGTKDKCFIDKWFEDPKKVKYRNVGVYPNTEKCPGDMLNLWKPFAMEFVDEYTPHLEGKEFILNHIKILCNHDEVVYNWFIRWVAQMIQYPEFKSVAPTLISDEGAGKGTLLKLIAKMLGGNRVLETTTPSRDVWGSNNNLLKNAFLVNLNEMSGKETVGADGQIKGLITDPKITINEKYVSSVVIDSFHRFLITTNNEECIRKKKGDRRNIIIRCSDELCVEMPKNVSRRNDLVEYHNKMHGLLEDQNVIKTMYEYFKNEIEDMSDFRKIPVPETEHDREQQEVNRSTIDIFMENFTREHINFTNDNNEPIMRVMISDLFKQFKRYCEKNRMEYDCNVLKFGLRLKRLNVVGVGQMVKTNKGNARILNIEQMKEYYKLGCLIDIDNTDNDSDSD